MKEENWIKKLIKKLKNPKLNVWYLEGTETWYLESTDPVEIVEFIEKLFQQEKERLINEIKQITSSQGTEIPVEIVGFIEKLLHQEKERLINEIKQITSNGEKWKTKKLFALLDELKNKKGRQK